MGALDDGDVDALAERLGVGERQLRRLFQQHVGASPISVAQTRRVHLAKQLIHDTDLSMTEVALASGFGSVRRFNETFQRLFRRPPASLRRGGRGKPTLTASVTLQLTYRPPYDWDAMLAFLAQRAIDGVETVRQGRYARSFRVDGATGFLTVEPGVGHTLHASDKVVWGLTSRALSTTIVRRQRRSRPWIPDGYWVCMRTAVEPKTGDLRLMYKEGCRKKIRVADERSQNPAHLGPDQPEDNDP